MALCGPANLSLIVKVVSMEGIIEIKDNRITGTFGKVLDAILDANSKKKRYCKLIGSYEFGSELDNGTYTGALGYLQSKKGDLCLQPGTLFFTKDFFEHSKTIFYDKIIAGQRLDSSITRKDIDLFEIFNFENHIKLFLFILTFIFLVILISLTYQITSKLLPFKLINNLLRFRNDYHFPVSKIGLCLIFYQLFYMLFKLVYSNQITTTIVLVDTSYIINTMSRLLETKSVICWLKNDMEIRMAEQSPKNSNLRRLLDEKKYSSPVLDMEDELSEYCLLSLKRIQTVELTNKVIFISEATLYGFLATFVAPDPDVSYWISPSLFETVAVYYFRKGLSPYQKKEINKSNYWRFENGISIKSYNDILFITTRMISSSSKYYTDLKLFISDNTIFTDLKLSFLTRIIIILLSVNLLTLFIFLIHILIYYRKSILRLFKNFYKNLVN